LNNIRKGRLRETNRLLLDTSAFAHNSDFPGMVYQALWVCTPSWWLHEALRRLPYTPSDHVMAHVSMLSIAVNLHERAMQEE